MKARYIFSLLAILLLSTLNLSAQPDYLIATVPASNLYPITFTDNAQQTIWVEFDRAVTNAGTAAGWTVKVNTVPVALSGAPIMAGNKVRLIIVSSISFANRNSVLVSYSAAAGTLELTGPVEPNFTDQAAVNNWMPVQGDFSNGLYGEIPPNDICAAVENVEVSSNITIATRYRNSIFFRTPRMNTLWMFPALAPKTDPDYIETGGVGSGIFSKTNTYAAYPNNTTNCTWVISIWPYVPPLAPFTGLSVTDRQVFITIPNYKKDNGTPAPGTGDLGLNPPVDDPSTLFCVGEDIGPFTFTDATVFDCQYPLPEANLPNTRDRYAQFVYGTHTAAGIPNVYIKVGASMVQVTDNNGVALTGPWFVNPDGTPNGGGYTTPSGFFEGPVVQYLWDAGTKARITPLIQTYEIYHSGNFITDAENDIFDVTLRNWGPCNPYDAFNPVTYLDAVTEYSRLRLVAAPPLPTAPDVTVCNGGSTLLSAVRNGTNPGVLHWYDVADFSHETTTGATYNPGVTAAGVYNYWVREIATTGQNCIGPAEQVTLTIRSELSSPGTISGPDEVCTNQAGAVFSILADPPVMPVGGATEYFWTVPADWTINSGQGTKQITVTTGTTTGSRTVSAVTRYTSAPQCPTSASTFTTNLNPVVTINSAASKTVCENTSVAYTATSATTGCTFAWTRAVVAGISNGAGSGSTAVINESLNNTTTAPVNVTYVITASKNGCPGTPFNLTVTVNPAGQVNDPTNQIVCNSGSTTAVNFSTNNTGGTTSYSWSNNTTSIGLAASGTGNIASFTATNTGTSPVTATITVTPTFTNNTVGCAGTAETFTITVNPSAQVNDPANQVRCVGEATAAVNFATNRTGGTTTYAWTNNNTSIGLGASGTGNIPSFTTTNSGTTTITATITVTPTFTNGSVSCSGTAETFTIRVNPNGQVNDPANMIVCNSDATGVTFTTNNTGGTTTYAWTNTNTAIGLASSGSGNLSFTATNTGTSPISATITVTPTYTNYSRSCAGTSESFTITVNPSGQVNDPADQVRCNGEATAAVNFATTRTGGTTTYAWTNNNTSIGLAASGTGNIASFSATNTGTAPVVATVTVTPTFTNGGTSCAGTAQTFTITVNPTGQVNQPADYTVCNSATGTVNFATANTVGTTTYAWTNTNTAIGLAASGSGNLSFTATNTGTSPISGTIVVTPTFTYSGRSCSGPTKTFTITVNPSAQVNDPTDQTRCTGTATAAVNFSTNRTGGTTSYSWTNNNTSIGLAASGTGNIASFTATNAGTSPVTATITVTPTFTNNSVGCTGTAQTFTITVNPSAQVNDPSNQNVCNGAATAAVNFTTTRTGGTTTYSWTNNNTTIGLAASGTGDIASFTATNVTTAPVTATITVTPSFTNNSVSCSGTAQTFTITVNPTAVITSASTKTVCSNTPLAYTATSSTAGVTFAWTRAIVAGISNPAGSGTAALINESLINTTGSDVNVIYAITPTYGSCPGTTFNLTVTVHPQFTLSQLHDDVSICNNSAYDFNISMTGGTSPYTVNYTKNGTPQAALNNYVSGTDVSTGVLTTASYIYQLTSVTDFYGCPVQSLGTSITVTVGSPLSPATLVSSGDACFGTSSWIKSDITGGAPPYILNYTKNGTPQTEVNPYPDNSNINLGVLAVGSYTMIITSIEDGCGDLVPSFVPASVIINIKPIPDASTTSNAAPTICNNSNTNIVLHSDVPNTDFSWTVSYAPAVTWQAGKDPAIGAQPDGEGLSIAQNLAHNGSYPVTVTYTITPTGPGATACPGTAITRDVVVNPAGQVNDPSNVTYCNTDVVPVTTFTTNRTVGTTTYAWSNSNTAIGLGASGTGSLPSFTATNTGTAPISATITVTPTFTHNSVACTGTAETFTITVNPTAQVNDPSDVTFCNTAATGAIAFTTNRTVGTTTYAWSNSNTAIGLGASGTGNLPSFTATNAGTAPISATITVTPTFTHNSVACTGTAETFTITINPTAQVNDPSNVTYCNTDVVPVTTFTTNRTVGTTTYAWSNSNTAIGLGASGTGNLPSFTATNAGTAPISATITVTPTFTHNSVACTGTAETFTITVNPTAQVNDPADVTFCNTAATGAIAFTTNRTVGATTYAWSNSNTAIGLGASGSGNLPSFTATNAGTAPISATITVTPTFTYNSVACTGTAQTFTITINPTAQVNDPSNQILCNGATTTLVSFSTNRTGGTTTYTWSNSAPSIGLAASGSGDIAAFAAENTGTAPVIATITITPTFTNNSVGCAGPTETFTITVNPTPKLSTTLTPADVCSNTPFSYAPASATGSTTFNWSRATVAGITPAGPTNGTNNPNETLRNLTGGTIAVTYEYTLAANGCSNIQNVVVNIKPEPVITAGQIIPVCSGNSVNYEILLDNFTDPVTDGVTFTWPAPVLDPIDAGFTGGTARVFPGSSANIGDTFTNTLGGIGKAIYTITPYKGGCAGDPVTIEFQVGAEPTLDPGLDRFGCNDEAIGLILKEAAGSVVPTHYDILSVTPDAGLTPDGGNAIFPASTTLTNYLANDKYTNTTLLNKTVTYRVQPRVGVDCIGDPLNIVVTIYPPITPGSVLTSKTSVCFNTDAPVISNGTLASGGDGTYNYQWFFTENLAAGPGDASWTSIGGATSSFYDPGNLSNPTKFIRRADDGTCAAQVWSNIIQFNIDPLPVTSAIDGLSNLCIGDANKLYRVDDHAGSTYSWTVPGAISSKAFDANIYFILVNANASGTGNIQVTETITATGCVGAPVTFPLTVSSASTGVVPTGPAAVCEGATGVIYSLPFRAGSTFSWSLPPGAFITAGDGTNQITVSFPAPISGNVTALETNGSCTTAHLNKPVAVKPKPVLSSSLTPPGICSASTFSYTPTCAIAGATFAWTRAAVAGITEGASGAAGNVSETLTNTTNAPISVTYVYITTADGCTGDPQNVVVVVNPAGHVNDPSDLVLCNGAPSPAVTFTSLNSGGTTTYAWTNDNTSIGLGASGSANIPSFTAVNTGTSQVTATITVTPTFHNGLLTCAGTPETFTIKVNPSGHVTDPANFTVCNTDVVAPVVFATNNTDGATTYTWTNSAPGIGLPASGSGDLPGFTADNTGTSPVVATITVTPVYTNGSVACNGPAETFTITVNPTGQVNDPADQVACNGSLTNPVTFSTNNTGGTTTYSWTNSDATIGLAGSGTGNIGAFTAVNTGLAQKTVTITVTPRFTNNAVFCDGTPETFTFTINPSADVVDPADQLLCNGAATAAVNFTTANTDGTVTYSWTNNVTGIGLPATGTGNIASFTAVNSGTAPVTASIIVTPHYTNGAVSCNGPTETFTITVNPTGQVNDPADRVVCNGVATPVISFTTNNTGGTTQFNWTSDNTAIGIAASGTGNILSFSAINAGTAPVVANITVTPLFSNGAVTCNGPTQTFTITVNPDGNVVKPADQVVCNGSSTAAVTFASGNSGGITTYTWSNSDASIGLPVSGSGNLPIFTATNTGTDPVVATITVTPTFTNGAVACSGPAESFTITVNPTANVVDPANQVVCNGALTAAVNFTTTNGGGVVMDYNWTNSEPGIGLAASGNGDIAAFAAENTGTSPVVATITVTPELLFDGKTCYGPAQTFTITVNPTAQVNDPADQVVCNGAATTAVNFGTINTVGATTYTWTNSAPGIGLAASGSGNIASFTAENTGSTPVVANIIVTPVYTNGAVSCNGPTQTFTITVNPTAQVDPVADEVVCNGAATTAVTFSTTNGGGTTVYNWSNSAPGIGLPATGVGNIASFTASNITTAPVVATITVTPQYTNAGVTCSGPAETYTITVNPTAQVNDPADQVVCHNGTTTAINFTTNNSGGTTVYNWVNDTPGIGLAASGNTNIASFTATNTGSVPVVATITVTPEYTNDGESCTGPAQTFTITVNPLGQVNDPLDQVVCNGGFTDPVTFTTANTGGTTTYTWTNNTPSIGLGASGSGNIGSFAAINGGLGPVTATITVTPHFSNGSVSCTGSVQTFTITVNPTAKVTDPANQVVCHGGSTADVIFATTNTGGTVSYTWTNDETGIGLPASGSGDILSFPVTNTGTSPLVATITVIPSYLNATVSCTGPAQTFTITVNPLGQVNDPADQVVCNGSPVTPVTFATVNTGGTTTYNWVNSVPGIGLAATGSGNISTFNAVNTGTTPVVATITVTPRFNNGSVDCDGAVQTFTITVNPTAQVNNITSQVVCNAAPVTAITFGTDRTGGTTTYNWTNNASSIGLAASGSGDIASFTATNTGTSPVIATITVTPIFTNGAVSCSGPSKSFTITVNPTAQVNDPADRVVCNGVLTTAIPFTTVNTGGTTSYTWTNSNTAIGLGAGSTGPVPAFTATNAGLAQISATITVTPSYTNGSVTCSGPAETFTITVNPSAQADIPANQELCNSEPSAAVTFTTTRTDGTTTYSWTNNKPSIGLAAVGTGNLPIFTASNITTAPVEATITVTPVYTNGAVSCNGPTQTFTITVNPTGQVNKPADQTVCVGQNTSAVNFVTLNTVGTTDYSWSNDNTAIGLVASGTGNIPAFLTTNATTAPITGTITVTPTFNNGTSSCPGPAQTFTITVNPLGQVEDITDQVVCNGSSTANVIFSTVNTGGTTSYSWTNSAPGIGLPATGSGNIPFFTAINAGTDPVIATITVIPEFTNNFVSCTGPSKTFTITVNPTANVVDPSNQVVCNGDNTTAVNFTTTNGGGVSMVYNWTNSAPGIGLPATGSGNIAAFPAENLGSSPVVATITVTPELTFDGKTCTGPSQTFTITVNPTAQVNDPADQVVCKGAMTTGVFFSTNNTGGTTVYNWSNSETGIGLVASGVGNIASFAATNTGTVPLVATITVTPVYTNGSVSCNGSPETFTITVNPTAQVNDITSETVCNGDLTTAVTFSSVNTVGTTTYNWTNDATSIGLAAMGSGNIAAFTAVNNTTAPVVATITVTPQFTYGAVTCSGPSKTFTITVNPTAQVNDPADLVVCNTQSTSVTFATNRTGGTTTYNWTNSAPGIGIPAIGSGDIGPFAADNSGTAPVTATIVVTPSFDNAGKACTGPAQTFTITVNPTGQVEDISDQVVCHGAYTTAVAFSTLNTGGTTTYTWTNSAPGIGLPASGNGNISAFSAINTGTAPVTATITVIPHFTNGLVTCDGPSKTFTITVNQKGQVNDPADKVVCNGGTVSAYTFTTTATGGTTTYLWTNSAPGIGLLASGSGDIASFTAINTGTAPVVATVTVTPRLSNGTVDCDGPVQTFTITVNPDAQVNDPADQVVCNGANVTAINFTTLNTGGMMTYDWTNSATGIGLPAIGSGNIAAFTATNSGTSPVTATITVTPGFTNGSVTCTGAPQTFTITVNPTPDVSTVSPTTICSGSTTNVALTSTVAGTSFSWTIAGTTGGVTGASASSGSTIAQILVNPGTTAGTVTYRVTPTANSCSGTPVDIIVTVNPTPNVTYTGSTTICSATSTNIALHSNVIGATYTWTVGTITGGITGAAASGGATISQVLTNPGNTAGTVTYVVTPTANSCPGITSNIIVTVNPTPDVSTASSLTICSATATNIALTSSVAGATFSWTIGTVTGGIVGATPSNGTTIAQTLYNTGLTPGTVEYRVTPSANSCPGPVTTFTVTVNPLTGPTNFITGAPEVCQDSPDEIYTATATNSTSIVYTVSPAAAGTINSATGIMNWDPAYYGNVTITATSTGLCGTTVGTMTVRVKQLPAVTVSPVDRTICEFGVVNFDVTAVGDDLAYQWYVDDNLGGGFVPVPGGGSYSGETSSTLSIWSAVRSMNGYKYRVEVSGCPPPSTSSAAVLTVNTSPEFTKHPKDTTICLGNNTIMEADADGTGITWQWQVNKGSGFGNVADDANFSGSNTKTLTITSALSSFNNWVFRAKATGVCGVPLYTNFGRLSVVNPPAVTLQPVVKAICENGSTSFLANGTGYLTLQWQVSTNGGTSWADITDDATYVGSVTNQLSIVNAPVSLNGNMYRLALIGSCATTYTTGAAVTVNQNPVVAFASDINACGGIGVVLNGNPTGGTLPYTQHRWTGDVGPLSNYTSQSPTFNSLITGTYNLTYTVKDSKGCTASDDIAVTVDSPNATFIQDTENGCTPLPVSFTKDMTGLTKFWWNFGDGSAVDSVNASPSHTFVNTSATSIQYMNVKLKVMSPGGCFDEYISMVTVYPAIDAAFTRSDTVVCSGSSLTFTSAPGASKYFWEYGDGITGYSPTESTTHTYSNFTTAPLQLTVKLTTTSFYSCTDDTSMTITVMPVPLPQFNAVPPSQIYDAAGNNVTFTNQTNDGAWSYSWNFGDGGTSADKDPVHTYRDLGTFDVVLRVSNAFCSDSIKHEVRINPKPPVANFDSIPSGCEPLEIGINNTSLNTDVPGTTYRWDFGDGSISTAKNPDYTYLDAGIYRIELVVTGPGGVSSKSQVVKVYATPRSYFEVTPTFVFVNDEKVRGYNLSSGADNFKWDFGDGTTSTEKEPFHKYMEEGVYDITLWAYKDNGNGNVCADKYLLSPGVTVEPAGEIRFSTVFTPNKEGPIDKEGLPTGGSEMDQFFFPPIREKVIDYKLQIFNRLGVLIFESHDINKPWNGYYKGNLCSQGVYVWYVEGKYANGQPFKKVGDVTLLH